MYGKLKKRQKGEEWLPLILKESNLLWVLVLSSFFLLSLKTETNKRSRHFMWLKEKGITGTYLKDMASVYVMLTLQISRPDPDSYLFRLEVRES
jgi:hypothetical protein